ncbi:hypothetical protein [Mycolicibacterium sp.]|uniref:gasdermin n=1 Tax=Mycolicibacterium sp. TaxID=2320850 RepID=UPI0037C6016E
MEGPIDSAELSGKSSSSLSLGIGAEILGSFVGAMGGKLGADTSYTNAKKMTFVFADVTKKRVAPAQAGAFMTAGDLSTSNPVLVPWVLGKGQIYLITEVAYSTSFAIRYERSNGQAATVEVPALGELAGLNVKVETKSNQSNVVTFHGKKPLAFAFKCFEIGYLDGKLAFSNLEPGAVALSDVLDSAGEPIEPGVCLAGVDDVQLIDLR